MQSEVDELFPSLCAKKNNGQHCNLALICKTGKIIEIMTVLSLVQIKLNKCIGVSHQYWQMFNLGTDDLAVKPYIPHKSLLQWICFKCLAW